MKNIELQKNFEDVFGSDGGPIRQFFAPGRVNLLGEHTDYNGGLVFPCAINFGTALLVRQSSDDRIRLRSQNFDYHASLTVEQTKEKHGDYWINYPLGVIDQFRKRGIEVSGLEFLFSGDIPHGAGLSSSASVEVVTAFAINQILQSGLSAVELVKMSQAAENDFVGLNCGIMDQYASAMGKKGHGMKLDCETLACEQVPLELAEHCFVIINSNQRRDLTESGYNDRFSESRQALEIIREKFDLTALAHVSQDQLLQLKEELGDLLYRRVRHIVTEHQRVMDAAVLLSGKDLKGFGRLMNESHDSMRDDYETSTDIINTLVSLAQGRKEALGARLTGGGFGGCIVALVEKDGVSSFVESVTSAYQEATGLIADAYPVNVEQGVREIVA